jgi:hypothetical protein
MNVNNWKVSDECRATVAALIAGPNRPATSDDAASDLTDAILTAVEAEFARAARAAFERTLRPSDN